MKRGEYDFMANIIDFLRKFKIRTRIAALLLIGLLIFSIIIFQASKIYAQVLIKDYLYDYVEVTQEEMNTSLELMIDSVNMLAARLLVDQNIYDLLNDDKLSHVEKEEGLKNILNGLLVHKDVVGDIIIIGRDGQAYEYASRTINMPVPDEPYIRRIEQASMAIWGDIERDADNNAYIMVGRKYRNFYTGQDLGYLIMYVRENALYDLYAKIIPEGGYSFIVSKDNHIISHSNKEMVGSIVFDNSILSTDKSFDYKIVPIDGQPTIVAIHQFSQRMKSLGIDWNIISAISQNQLFGIIDRVNKYILAIEVIMAAIAVLLSIYISLNITRPLTRLKNKLNAFGRGNMSVVLFKKPNDEIGELEKNFNDMVIRIKELIKRNNEEKEKQREMELIALQAQINPHFIYNTLDTIGWIAKIKKQDEIERLVIALATFFRISLHKGDKYITVQEEIQLIQSFVTIELMRFPDKFDIEYNIPDEIKDYKMLKIILQPLVENAIKHGIDKKKGKGHIEINGHKDGQELIFEVIDDGVGFDPNAVDFQKSYDNIQRSGYGLRNVDERIKLEYGQDCGLTFYSEVNKGTRVMVKLKIKQSAV